MKNFKLILGLLILVTIFRCATEDKTAAKFQGMWRLEKFEEFHNGTGSWMDDSTRVGVTGYILYDGLGHMGVHLLSKGYKDFNTNRSIDSLNSDELKEFVKFYQSNFVYFADYITTDSSIEHKRLTATEPSNWGTSLTRSFEFKNDTLVLTAQEAIGGRKLRLRWIKI